MIDGSCVEALASVDVCSDGGMAAVVYLVGDEYCAAVLWVFAAILGGGAEWCNLFHVLNVFGETKDPHRGYGGGRGARNEKVAASAGELLELAGDFVPVSSCGVVSFDHDGVITICEPIGDVLPIGF